MKYNRILETPYEVAVAGFVAPMHQITWAVGYDSIGEFNYESTTLAHRYVLWRFSNKEDAVLFALKFK